MSGRAIPLLGLKFGDLTVTEYMGHQIWRTSCACGGSRDLNGHLLRGGSAKACFACTPPKSRGKKILEDLTGQTFHELTARQYLGHRIYLVECTCGGTREVTAWSLKSGQIKRCTKCRKELLVSVQAAKVINK